MWLCFSKSVTQYSHTFRAKCDVHEVTSDLHNSYLTTQTWRLLN